MHISGSVEKLTLTKLKAQHRMISEVAEIMIRRHNLDKCSRAQAFISIALEAIARERPNLSTSNRYGSARIQWRKFSREGIGLPELVYDRCIGILNGEQPPALAREVLAGVYPPIHENPKARRRK